MPFLLMALAVVGFPSLPILLAGEPGAPAMPEAHKEGRSRRACASRARFGHVLAALLRRVVDFALFSLLPSMACATVSTQASVGIHCGQPSSSAAMCCCRFPSAGSPTMPAGADRAVGLHRAHSRARSCCRSRSATAAPLSSTVRSSGAERSLPSTPLGWGSSAMVSLWPSSPPQMSSSVMVYLVSSASGPTACRHGDRVFWAGRARGGGRDCRQASGVALFFSSGRPSRSSSTGC